MTCMNDARKFQQEHRARLAAEVLSRVPDSLCLIAGPADAATWQIHDAKWDGKAKIYTDILKTCGHPVSTARRLIAL